MLCKVYVEINHCLYFLVGEDNSHTHWLSLDFSALMNVEIWKCTIAIWRSPVGFAKPFDLVEQKNAAEVSVNVITSLWAVPPALHVKIYLCKALCFGLTPAYFIKFNHNIFIISCFRASEEAQLRYLGDQSEMGAQTSPVALDLTLSQLNVGALLACRFA